VDMPQSESAGRAGYSTAGRDWSDIMGLGDIIWASDIMISFCAYVISDIMVLD